jgi:S1-C subfamily serine protease
VLPKALTLIFLTALSAAAFGGSPKPIPADLAKEARDLAAEEVFDLLNILKDAGDTKDLQAVEAALLKIPTYLERGSVKDATPSTLLTDLTVYCNTPENYFTTWLIVDLCKDYKQVCAITEDTAFRAQHLELVAEGVTKGLKQFFAVNPVHKQQPENSSIAASFGSGFIISPDGYILTNDHVIAESTQILVTAPSHKPLAVSVVLSDPDKDLALLKLPLRKLPLPNLPYLPIADSDLVQVLDTVYVLGYPLAPVLGTNVSASEGKINAIRIEGRTKLFQFDADVNPGNSGGPLLNDKGEVIGIVVSKLNAIKMLEEHGTLPERINFAIPINEARLMLRKTNTCALTASTGRDVLSASKIFDNSKGATVLITATSSQETPSPAEPEPTTWEKKTGDVTAFVKRFVVAGNSDDSGFEASFYADKVDYFDDGKVTTTFVEQDIQKYNQRWPQRRYWINGEPTIAIVNSAHDIAEATVTIGFVVQNRQRIISGTCKDEILIIDSTTNPKIGFIRSKMLNRQIKTLSQ